MMQINKTGACKQISGGTMNRRDFGIALGALPLLSSIVGAVSRAEAAEVAKPKIGMLIYPGMILQDLVGPQTVFSILQADVRLVWKDKNPVATDVGIAVSASDTFDTCPANLDVLFVPGGLGGSIACMKDADVIGFLASRGPRARYVTSVCTGSLVLAAAGLLRGYQATSHWYVRDLLPLMGAILKVERVVEDRNRLTAGGVTSGIDFGLTLAARLADEDTARRIQLLIEYDPKPPFAAGSPESAGQALAGEILQRRAPLIASARKEAEMAKERLGI
ncbi:DJ-1/PfpI family protein [Bradyrhizobium sp. WSM2254]|uniref:DJ-1/PfpI family protein n=1 Tax=Bradyrhizobium sp. WSM2254 TaxID=1188263 RepID=UPI001FD99738|nr:DJ-1/PfpI family protein [Bradyrhizobium sp. WSM2254]